ncbi:Glycosyl transferase family 1 [Hyphomicrobiales bacterium]|nr:Glycosyl transferase family 1 [Hyphomicrobiales bacterium]CAH1665356.1 Glycosyl transferase family 1 [Hyphomicrobiales bacterium]
MEIMNLYAVSHAIWRRLPKGPRQAAYARLAALISPRPDPAAPRQATAPWIVAGVLRSPTGLGQAARLALEALRASGEPVFAADVTAALRQPLALPPVESPPLPEGPGTVILFGVPPTTGHALRAIGKRALAGKRVIGCWFWELERAPNFWKRDARLLHEVVSTSQFGCAAIATTLGQPVRQIVHPLTAEPLPEITRASHLLPGHHFRVGFACDFGSTTARKNPLAVVAAFEKAFATKPDTTLSLKVRDPSASPAVEAKLREVAQRLGPRFELVAGDLSREASLNWLANLDLYLSLHRSEGFGLPIAEAMRLGVPVAVTDWSAPTEFVDDSCGFPIPYTLIPVEDASGLYALPGARWADADVDAAADILRYARQSPVALATRAVAARERIEELYNTGRFLQQLRGGA